MCRWGGERYKNGGIQELENPRIREYENGGREMPRLASRSRTGETGRRLSETYSTAALKVVQGLDGRSRKTPCSQRNSGCFFRCSEALKLRPQEWPMAAVKDIPAISLESAALFCTAPQGPYFGCQGFDPRGDRSMW